MTVSRAQLIARAAARLGGHSGTLSFTAGVSNRAILAGQVGTSNDDSKYDGWQLFMLDAATEADRERTVTSWQSNAGIAGWDIARADTTSTSENYILVPDYSLDEFRAALNLALKESKRTYRSVLPLTPDTRRYTLSTFTWLEGADDIDGVWVSDSPNMLHNEDFNLWQNGSALAPDGWTLAGSGATVLQSATGIRSPYSAQVTRASADATLYQDLPLSLVQYLARASNAPLPIVSFGAWATSSTASIARVGVYNGTSTTWSSYHTGNGVPQFLSSSYQTTASITALRLVCSVDTTNGAASFHFGALCPTGSTFPSQLQDHGSDAYFAHETYAVPRNEGGWPVVELAHAGGYGQLIIYSRRPYAAMTVLPAALDTIGDTEVVHDSDADTILSGLLRYLLDAEKPNQDRTRLDRLRGEEAAKWTRALKKKTDRPVPDAPRTVLVGGV